MKTLTAINISDETKLPLKIQRAVHQLLAAMFMTYGDHDQQNVYLIKRKQLDEIESDELNPNQVRAHATVVKFMEDNKLDIIIVDMV